MSRPQVKILSKTRFGGIDEPKFETLKACIEFFYSTTRNFTEYLDKQVHCSYGRYRSIEDCFSFCTHRFPNCTLEDVVRSIYKLWKDLILIGHFCYEIRKYVFYYYKPLLPSSARVTPGNSAATGYPEYIQWGLFFDSLNVF